MDIGKNLVQKIMIIIKKEKVKNILKVLLRLPLNLRIDLDIKKEEESIKENHHPQKFQGNILTVKITKNTNQNQKKRKFNIKLKLLI